MLITLNKATSSHRFLYPAYRVASSSPIRLRIGKLRRRSFDSSAVDLHLRNTHTHGPIQTKTYFYSLNTIIELVSKKKRKMIKCRIESFIFHHHELWEIVACEVDYLLLLLFLPLNSIRCWSLRSQRVLSLELVSSAMMVASRYGALFFILYCAPSHFVVVVSVVTRNAPGIVSTSCCCCCCCSSAIKE